MQFTAEKTFGSQDIADITQWRFDEKSGDGGESFLRMLRSSTWPRPYSKTLYRMIPYYSLSIQLSKFKCNEEMIPHVNPTKLPLVLCLVFFGPL